MSFFSVKQTVTRLNRSELAVPGSSPEFFEKAAKSDTDVIFLDLEDAVAPDDKEQARKNIIKALNEINFVGADVVEVSPPFDLNNMTSLVGATMAFEILCTMTRTNSL